MNYKFERAARVNKMKAFVLTVGLHVILIGGFTMQSDQSITEMLPEKVKTFLGIEADVTENPVATTKKNTPLP